jgi:hypothetical protein
MKVTPFPISFSKSSTRTQPGFSDNTWQPASSAASMAGGECSASMVTSAILGFSCRSISPASLYTAVSLAPIACRASVSDPPLGSHRATEATSSVWASDEK